MTSRPIPLRLNGQGLTCEMLEAATVGAVKISLCTDGLTRMGASRMFVEKAIAEKTPVYGVTTGLGAKAREALSEDELVRFSLQSIRGRAHATGPFFPDEHVRASLLVRLNTLMIGASGARPEIAEGLKAWLEAGATPAVRSHGSIGTGDLVLNASAALALVGEGEKTAGNAAPLTVAARDGLALINHTGFSAGLSALAVAGAARLLEAVQTAAAMSMEGFGANLSVLDERALSMRPQPGQEQVAARLRSRLEGSRLEQAGAARRLQDPLSIRNVPQVHGAVYAALAFAREAAEVEISGASDNPAVLIDDALIVSTGAYLTPHLTNAIEKLNRSIVQMVTAQVARLSKLLSARFTDLPLFLAASGSHSNGFAPLMKTAESLLAELTTQAAPAPVWPSVNADGVEDLVAHTVTTAQAAMKVVDLAARLTAIEFVVGAQAMELRHPDGEFPPSLNSMLQNVRRLSSALLADRPLGEDIEALAIAVKEGQFS